MSDRAASCTILFTFTAPLAGGEEIPAGFIIETSGGVQFATAEGFVATGAETEYPLKALAVVLGDSGNGFPVGEVSVMPSPLAFVATASNIDITSNSTESINPEQPDNTLFWKHFRDDLERVIGVPTFMVWDMPEQNLPTTWITITPNGKIEIDVEVDILDKYFGFTGELNTYEFGCTIEVRSGISKRQQYGNKTYYDAQIRLAEVLPLYVGATVKLPKRTQLVSPFSESVENPRTLPISVDWGRYWNTPDIELVENKNQEIFFDENNTETNYIAKGWEVKLLTVRNVPANLGTGGIINGFE